MAWAAPENTWRGVCSADYGSLPQQSQRRREARRGALILLTRLEPACGVLVLGCRAAGKLPSIVGVGSGRVGYPRRAGDSFVVRLAARKLLGNVCSNRRMTSPKASSAWSG